MIYSRTQTHASHHAEDWLRKLINHVGLSNWDIMAQSQTHCAGGLAAIDLLHRIGWSKPAIVLTGEKCFHTVTANQAGALLGEAAAAVLLHPECSAGWNISHRRTWHLPQFNANPDRMPPELRKTWEAGFCTFLQRFLKDSLKAFQLDPLDIDFVVPYNLNLPLLETISQK